MAKKIVKNIEVVEEVKDTKKTEKKKESLASKIIWYVVLGLTIIWLIIFLVDFFGTKSGKPPKFCVGHEIKDYTDGSVEVCYGIGYKYIEYDRENKKGTEFEPFWISIEDK